MASKKKNLGTILNVEEVGTELLATSIIDVADAAKKLLNSGLTEHAIHVLIKDKTGIALTTIKAVLNAAADLKSFTKR